MIFVMLPMLTPGRKQLNEKYQALGMRRLGHILHSYYRSNGFPMPGELKTFQGQFKLTHCPPLTGLESFAPLMVPAPVPHPLECQPRHRRNNSFAARTIRSALLSGNRFHGSARAHHLVRSPTRARMNDPAAAIARRPSVSCW